MDLPKLKKVTEKKKKKIILLSDDLRMSSGVGTMSREIVFGTIDKYDWIQVGGAIKHPDNGKIVDIRIENIPQVYILIDIGIPIIARITRKSLSELQLTKGTQLFTMVKAVAIDKKSIGHLKNNTTSTVWLGIQN